MKVLVIGGTSGTGKQIITQALDKGHEVTAIVRNTDKVKTTHPSLQVLKGDVLKPETLREACNGQDAVLCALGHKKFFIKTTILSRGTKNLISAMREKGVRRLICITALGINDSRFKLGLYYSLFVHPIILFFYFRDKEKQEKLIMNADLDWTIVRPGQLTNGRRKERYKHGQGLGHYVFTKMISRADVAHFVLTVLDKDLYVKKVAGITN